MGSDRTGSYQCMFYMMYRKKAIVFSIHKCNGPRSTCDFENVCFTCS